nr:MAG TPA: hypothetical protein [Bacteriophage sp.]
MYPEKSLFLIRAGFIWLPVYPEYVTVHHNILPSSVLAINSIVE